MHKECRHVKMHAMVARVAMFYNRLVRHDLRSNTLPTLALDISTSFLSKCRV